MKPLIALLILAGVAAAAKQPPEFDAFAERTKKYAQLHKELKSKLPDLKDKSGPERITAVEKGLAAALQVARRDAKQGDILTPDMRPLIMSIMKAELKGAANQGTRQAVHVGNPRTGAEKAPVTVKVNGTYSQKAPLSLVPPSLLKHLPGLPEQLEYRFVGKHLILRDTIANIIVDFMPDVLP